MNFFVNKAMGIGNSGVEHAQFYRAHCFDSQQLPYKYVFTEFVKNLPEAMAAWNLASNQVINLWEFLVLGERYLFDGAAKVATFSEEILVDDTNTHRVKRILTSSGLLVLEHLEKSPNPKNPQVLLVSTCRMEFYDYQTMTRKVMYDCIDHPRRGRIMQNIHVYDFAGQHLFFRTEVQLQRFFFHQLAEKFGGVSNFFIDRGQESEAALFGHRPANSRLIELIHADHLSDREVVGAPLWNNYYEYLLTHLDEVDRVVVATELQRQDLLVDLPHAADKIIVIPVGGIRDFEATPIASTPAISEKPQKFITASRLASEKHLHLVIKAIHEARQKYPDISLDIYGQGSEDTKLRQLIVELDAQAFIQLKGHSHQIQEVYQKYDAFISGSFSEGFGLTYIEALNAGLPIVTFNARFGAMELVESGVNGFLQDFSRTDEDYSVAQLVTGIEQLMAADWLKLVQQTRTSVANFQDTVIAQKWRDLVDEL